MTGSRIPWGSRRDDKRGTTLKITALLVTFLLAASTFWIFFSLQQYPGRSKHAAAGTYGTLIIYIFRNTDPEALNNLIFFIQHGITYATDTRYLVALDPTVPSSEMPELPPLPGNAEFVLPPACFEMGVVGWLLYTDGRTNVRHYKISRRADIYSHNFKRSPENWNFVWVSSITKGPFQPVYVTSPWHAAFTQRLNTRIKLVGSTISCSSLLIDPAQPAIEHPHVQVTGAAATDHIGLSLLHQVGALDCHNNWLDNMRFGEFAASAAILNAGFGLDSLMLRYQGLDWRDKRKWKCNAMLDPRQEAKYDGASLNPLEVIFVRAEFTDVVLEAPTVAQAQLYADWAVSAPVNRTVQENSWLSTAARTYTGIMSQPASCFDSEFYTMASPIEFADFTAEEAYAHFKRTGYWEGRPYMFLC